VRVYAGVDPVTERRHDLIEIIRRAKRRPEGSRSSRPICEPIAERRHPWTNATVDQLLDRYLDQFDGAPNTPHPLPGGYVGKHISL
jgi:integrase